MNPLLQRNWVIILFVVVLNSFWLILFYSERKEITKQQQLLLDNLESISGKPIIRNDRSTSTTSVASTERCAKNGKQHGQGCGPNSIQCFIGHCICKKGWGGKYCDRQDQESLKNPFTPEYCSKITFETENKKSGYGKFDHYDYCYYYDHRYGCATTSVERWKAAQAFEDDVWTGAGHSSDRNDVHSSMFNNYAALVPHKELGDYAEFGCGPFTQTMTMVNAIKANMNRVVLVDPLLRNYLQKTTHCTYKTGVYLGKYTGDKLTLISAGAEDINFFHDTFDTVLMTNVLEHVVNAFTVLQNLYNSIKPGGIVIFSERWYDKKIDTFFKNKSEYKGLPKDLGHPIYVKKLVIDMFLDQFVPLSKNHFDYDPKTAYADDEGIYIIARKK